jgi:6-phosphofructokinase 1
MKRIAVLTSGGDAPGMNPAIRAVVRSAIYYRMDVLGVMRGYAGLIDTDVEQMDIHSVSGIIHRGGTILMTARPPAFRTEEGRRTAVANARRLGIDGLVVIGGDGSLHGALELHKLGLPVIGIPATIDNDLEGTEMAIGTDTALNTALRAIDALKDTASSHQRAFIIEVMGRNSGYLALMSGIAGGAENVLIPEASTDLDALVEDLKHGHLSSRTHFIIIVAEGARYSAIEVQEYLEARKAETGYETRVTILGHVQRGGSPSAYDRILASQLGAGAVEALKNGESGKMAGVLNGSVVLTSLEEVLARPKPAPPVAYRLAEMLASSG